MSLARKQFFTLALSLLLGAVVVFPQTSNALGDMADAMCTPVQQVCGCGMVMGPKGCIKGPNMFMCPCWDVTNDYRTNGQCVAQNTCLAKSTGGKDGFGLDQISKILGDLMGKLMQQGGGQQDGAQPPTSGTPSNTTGAPTCSLTSSTVNSNASSTTATLSWSSSGDATSATISPNVGSVSPNGSQSVTVTATTPYSMTVTGAGGTNYCSTTVLGFNSGGDTDKCSGLFAALYGCNDDDDTDTGTTTPPVASLVATPTTGTAPLSVVFTGNARSAGYTIDYGDGKETSVGCAHGTCSAAAQPLSINRTHVYEDAGTFTAKLRRHFNQNEANCAGTDCSVVAHTTITVTAQTSSSTTTSATTTPVFTNPSHLIPGLRGDIQIIGPGGTVIAGSRDVSGNTEVAGFYGGSTFSGQPTGVVAGLCRARPWANNFLSYVLPANFFDSLCTARGYQVGTPPPQAPVKVTQSPVQTTPKPAAITPATSSVPTVPPKVRVWAVPAKVPLGSRVSIFWTSQGVTSCLVTSPDGSFSQTTLAGGASTVALTGDTTFTISCLAHDGTPVTDFVTVNLSI